MVKTQNNSEEIRKLLANDPSLRFSDCQEVFAKKKLDISRELFNTVKRRYLHGRDGRPAPRAQLPGKPQASKTQDRRRASEIVGDILGVSALSFKEVGNQLEQDAPLINAIGFVRQHGGLEQARMIARQATMAVEIVEGFLNPKGANTACLTGSNGKH